MNPFSYGTIVRSPYFFNRHDECRRIVSTLSGGNNLVLFAPRRFGKTSLVLRAVDELEKENYTLIDCQVYNAHLASLGADEISRTEFLTYLKK